MGDKSRIEWTDATWNPVTGCTKVSPGCENCYIARTPPFRMAGRKFAKTCGEDGCSGHAYLGDGIGATTGVQLHPDRLDQPLRWAKPRRVFVNSLSDLFHADVPDEYIARVFAVMALTPRHTFQVLTKRHGRMRALLSSGLFRRSMYAALVRLNHTTVDATPIAWPLPNVWMGVSVEDQKRADLRIPALLDTPAAVRFLSCEPLLGSVDLRLVEYVGEDCRGCSGLLSPAHEPGNHLAPGEWSGIDWVIAGGESGKDARPMHPNWARSLRDQCNEAGVPLLFKQWGEWVTEDQSPQDATLPATAQRLLGEDQPPVWRIGKHAAGRELDGRTWDEYPC